MHSIAFYFIVSPTYWILYSVYSHIGNIANIGDILMLKLTQAILTLFIFDPIYWYCKLKLNRNKEHEPYKTRWKQHNEKLK